MFEGKIGMMRKKNIGVGILFSSSSQSTPTSGRSSIQPPGGVQYGQDRERLGIKLLL